MRSRLLKYLERVYSATVGPSSSFRGAWRTAACIGGHPVVVVVSVVVAIDAVVADSIVDDGDGGGGLAQL